MENLLKNSSTDNECPVCLEPITKNVNCCTTPCGHNFCFKCISKSMVNNTQCPCCRTELVEQTNDDDDDDETIGSRDTDDDDDDDNNDTDDSAFFGDDDEIDNEIAPIETIEDRFVKMGYTLTDALIIITERTSITNTNYNNGYMYKVCKEFQKLMNEVDIETAETNQMQIEDNRSHEIRTQNNIEKKLDEEYEMELKQDEEDKMEEVYEYMYTCMLPSYEVDAETEETNQMQNKMEVNSVINVK